MASVQEYLEMLSTSQLQAILREECEGRGNLPIESILMICDILSQRNSRLPAIRASLLDVCRKYS